MKVSLRTFLSTDLPTLDAWTASGELSSHMSRTMPRCEEALWWMILADEREVGTIWLEPDDPSENVATLGILIGDPEMRGKGIGREAIRIALDEAREAGSFPEVRLRVRVTNERAIRCYLALGFRQSGEFARQLPTGEVVKVLEMTLSIGK